MGLTCPKCKAKSGDDWSQCGGSCPMPMSPHFKQEDQREPYIDEDHLYNKYEMMKMANERNMKDKHNAQRALDDMAKEMQAIKWFLEGSHVNISTGICETTTYGYGELSDLGYWQYQLPGWFVELPVFAKYKVG